MKNIKFFYRHSFIYNYQRGIKMEFLSYVKNKKGDNLALQINLNTRKDITLEEIEDLEDIITYELLKEQENLDYNTEIEKILNLN